MKSTQAEVDLRIHKVSEWLIDGKNRTEICEYALNIEKWDITPSQIDRYIRKARDLIRESICSDLEYKYALAEERYESLYRKAIDSNDLRLASNILKEQVSLQGIDARLVEKQSGNSAGFYSMMNSVAIAIRNHVPPEVTQLIYNELKDNRVLAAPYDIEGYEAPPVYGHVAVEDMQKYGRTRTREELEEAGVFENELPDDLYYRQ